MDKYSKQVNANRLPSICIGFEDFIESHGLHVDVRMAPQPSKGYIASIEKCEFKQYPHDKIITSICGFGIDRDAAILDYAERISGLHMVVDAYRNTRRDIRLPVFHFSAMSHPKTAGQTVTP